MHCHLYYCFSFWKNHKCKTSSCPDCWAQFLTCLSRQQSLQPSVQTQPTFQPTHPPTTVRYPDSHLIVLQATGQGKQIEPISGVEIALKITTANVEMYYLHPLNPIYFMHILPSKLNMARSLYRKSLWEDLPLSYHRLIVGISLSNHAEASKCAGFRLGLSHCVLIAMLP